VRWAVVLLILTFFGCTPAGRSASAGPSTAAGPKDIGGLDGHLLGSTESAFNSSGWTKKDWGSGYVSFSRPHQLTVSGKSHPVEQKVSFRGGKLISAAYTLKASGIPPAEAERFYKALFDGLHNEYDASMFGGTFNIADLGSSGMTQIQDSQGDLLQLINVGNQMINLTVQSHEF
jgi:hypothetical protein